MSIHENQNENYAYEMLGVATAKGYQNAHLELLGGGALGVTIPLKNGRQALATWDLGLFIESADFAESGEWVAEYRFAFDEETDNFVETLWLQTTKALDALETYLKGDK